MLVCSLSLDIEASVCLWISRLLCSLNLDIKASV